MESNFRSSFFTSGRRLGLVTKIKRFRAPCGGPDKCYGRPNLSVEIHAEMKSLLPSTRPRGAPHLSQQASTQSIANMDLNLHQNLWRRNPHTLVRLASAFPAEEARDTGAGPAQVPKVAFAGELGSPRHNPTAEDEQSALREGHTPAPKRHLSARLPFAKFSVALFPDFLGIKPFRIEEGKASRPSLLDRMSWKRISGILVLSLSFMGMAHQVSERAPEILRGPVARIWARTGQTCVATSEHPELGAARFFRRMAHH